MNWRHFLLVKPQAMNPNTNVSTLHKYTSMAEFTAALHVHFNCTMFQKQIESTCGDMKHQSMQ